MLITVQGIRIPFLYKGASSLHGCFQHGFMCLIQTWREGRAAEARCLGIWLSIVAWQPHTILSWPLTPPSPLAFLPIPALFLPCHLSIAPTIHYRSISPTLLSYSPVLILSILITSPAPHYSHSKDVEWEEMQEW